MTFWIKRDGIVEGTNGNDLIDTHYTGDPEGDKIDANDSAHWNNTDLVHAFGGNDTVNAGLSCDTVYGGDGNDRLDGQADDDKLYGDAGNDTLIGGDGCNTLEGGSGDDVFVGGNGADTFNGGTGQDNLDYSSSTSGVTVNLATGVLSGGQAANDKISSGIDGVIGSNSADSLTGFDHQGTASSDTYTNQFWGNGGNDTIAGGGGNDQLFGGADQDSITGGAGDDTVDGGAGDDVLYGDGATTSGPSQVTVGSVGGAPYTVMTWDLSKVSVAGNNIFPNSPSGLGDAHAIGTKLTINTGTTPVAVGVKDSDAHFNDGDLDQQLTGTTTIDGNTEYHGDRFTPEYAYVIRPVGAVDASQDITVYAVEFDGNDTVGFISNRPMTVGTQYTVIDHLTDHPSIAYSDIANSYFTGSGSTGPVTPGNDLISGGDGSDSIYGGAGADTISGGNGDDRIEYGAGADVVTGGAGNDNIDDAPGFDSTNDASTVSGEDGNDTIWGTAAGDKLYGGNDNDQIGGESGDDHIEGGAGQDGLTGSRGNDTLLGGTGDDTMTGGEGNDVMAGGDDRDNFVGGNAGDNVDGGEGGVDNDTLDLRGLAISSIVFDPLNSENGTVNFTGGGSLVFTNIENILRDRDGIVDGTGGNDLINGAYTDPNGDKIDANDALLPGAGPNDDSVRAGDGNDTVLAGEGNDVVFGGNGDDSVDGGNANDTLNGEEGNDKLYGGEGNDSINGGNGNDLADGGNGSDVIDTSGSNPIADGFDPNPNDDKDTVLGGAGDDTIRTGDDADSIDGGTGADSIDAGIDNDTVLGGDGRDTVIGGDGNDVIDSSTGVLADSRPDQGYPGLYPADTDVNNDRDSVDAGAGDDVVRTGDDADTISAGEGNDTVDAGVDNDIVNAGDGNDNVVGGEGSDTIDAGRGDDLVYGGFGPGVPDSANIPDATDAAPNNGRDSISAGEGNDTVLGLDDKDTIDGGAGADLLDGGIDDDSITGAAGDDRIIGGQGADTLSGGDDRDSFVGGSAGDSVDGGEGGVDNDTLDLSGAGPLKIIYDPANDENGTVQFLDPTTRAVTGTMTFKNIENVIPCFTPGTLIATPRGEVPVETLRAGDRIITRDNGMQEIRWVGRRDLSWADLTAAPHLKPILIRQGSLGNGLPERDMMVSPNHRVLVANDRTALYFDEREVLVAAKHLAAGKGVHSVDAAGASYIHFMFDRHEVVLSNGAWTESFQPGDLTLKGMGNAQRSEIYDLFPELKTDAGVENYGAARRTLKRHEAMLISK